MLSVVFPFALESIVSTKDETGCRPVLVTIEIQDHGSGLNHIYDYTIMEIRCHETGAELKVAALSESDIARLGKACAQAAEAFLTEWDSAAIPSNKLDK